MVLDTKAASCVWDAAELDRLEDIAREAISHGRSFRAHIEELATASAFNQAVRMLFEVLQFIDSEPDPVMALDILRWKFGVHSSGPGRVNTLSCGDIARKYGIRKQAVSQAAQRLRLDVRKSGHLRSSQSKAKFSTTHFRRLHEPASGNHTRCPAALSPSN